MVLQSSPSLKRPAHQDVLRTTDAIAVMVAALVPAGPVAEPAAELCISSGESSNSAGQCIG